MRKNREQVTSEIYSGPVLVLGIVTLIEAVAFSLPFAYFPQYAISLGASIASIGLFTSSFMLTQALLSPKFGGLSDRIGRKKIILWGLFGDVVLGILTGLAPNWIWLLLIRVVNGAVSAAAVVPAEALLIDLVSSKKRGEASGFFMSMSNFGYSLGPVLGGFIQWATISFGLGLVNSFRIPYFFDSLLAFFAMVLVVFFIKETEERPKLDENPTVLAKSNQPLEVKLTLSIKVLLSASFIAGLGFGFILPVMALFYPDKFGIPYIQTGFIFTITGLAGFFGGLFAGRLSDRIGRKPLIGIGGFISRIFGIALPLTYDVGQATIVTSVRMISFSMSHPALLALRADMVPARSRGKIFGFFNTAFTAGMIVGPVIGTWLYSIYQFETMNLGGILLPGYGLPFFVNAILGLISTISVLIFVKHKNNP